MKIIYIDKPTKRKIDSINKIEENFIKNVGHCPQGLYGTFLNHLGTIIVDDKLEMLLEKHPEVENIVQEHLEQFKKDDWGDISNEITFDNNTEAKYFGDSSGMIAIYKLPFAYMRIDTVRANVGNKYELCTYISISKAKKDIYLKTDKENYEYNNDIKEKVEKFLKTSNKYME